MARLLLEGLPALLILYGVFLFGQIAEKRKHHGPDPRPVIQSLRRLLVADPLQATSYSVTKMEAYDALSRYDDPAAHG